MKRHERWGAPLYGKQGGHPERVRGSKILEKLGWGGLDLSKEQGISEHKKAVCGGREQGISQQKHEKRECLKVGSGPVPVMLHGKQGGAP